MAFVADARKPDSVDHFTFRDLAPGEENAIPQPIATDFDPEGNLLLGTECLTDACLCVLGAGSMPKAWNPEPMVIDSGAAAEFAAGGEAEHADIESVPTGYDITD